MSSSYCATVADRKTSAVVGGEELFSLAQCCYAVVVLLVLLLIVLVACSVAVHLSLMLQLADVGAHLFHFLHAFHVALKIGVLDFLVPKSLLPR